MPTILMIKVSNFRFQSISFESMRNEFLKNLWFILLLIICYNNLLETKTTTRLHLLIESYSQSDPMVRPNNTLFQKRWNLWKKLKKSIKKWIMRIKAIESVSKFCILLMNTTDDWFPDGISMKNICLI